MLIIKHHLIYFTGDCFAPRHQAVQSLFPAPPEGQSRERPDESGGLFYFLLYKYLHGDNTDALIVP